MNSDVNIVDTLVKLEAAQILISYTGFLSDQSLEGISQGIKSIFGTESQKPRKSRKVFSVFVESAQNIIFYSGRRLDIDGTRDGAGYGAIFIQKSDDDVFTISSATVVLADKKPDFEGRLDKLMAMSDEEVDAAYEEQLMAQFSGSEKGAGLGLYEIRRQSKALSFDFEPYEDNFILITRAEI